MARPTKKGLRYFTLDVDILDDPKIIPVTVNFGAKGIAVTIALLCAIYREGYYIQWREETALQIAHKLPGITPELADKVVDTLARYGFFDKDLFVADRVLTSAGIQRRYLMGKKGRVDTSALDYWLLPPDRVLDSKTPVLGAKTPVLGAKTPPKENKIDNNIPNGLLLSSSTTTPARGKPSGQPPPYGLTPEWHAELQALLADDQWLYTIHGSASPPIPPDIVRALVTRFIRSCHIDGKGVHTNTADAKSHFRLWLTHIPAPYDSNTDPIRQPAARRRSGRRPATPGCGLIDPT